MNQNYQFSQHTQEELVAVLQSFPIPIFCFSDSPDDNFKVVAYNSEFLSFFYLEAKSIHQSSPFLKNLFTHFASLKNAMQKEGNDIICSPMSLQYQTEQVVVQLKKIYNNLFIALFFNEKMEVFRLLDKNEQIHNLESLFDELESVMQNEIRVRLTSERRYRQLFHIGYDGIFILTARNDENRECGNILEANHIALQIVGLKDIQGVNFLQLIPEKERGDVSEKLHHIQPNDNLFINATIINQQSQIPFSVEICGQLFICDNQRNIYLAVRDISERLVLEKEREKDRALLLQQSKMASMGEMIGVIAHQWRQPLNVLSLEISSLHELFCEGSLDQESCTTYINRIYQQIDFMSQTINDFRDFFSPSKQAKYFSPKKVLESVVAMLEPQFLMRSCIRININDETCQTTMIYGFSNEFKQALLVLIQNAKDAIQEKIQQQPDFLGEIYITIQQVEGNSAVEIGILDNAGGVCPADLPYIFDPYFSTKGAKGSGVGLPTAKMIIERSMHGKIRAFNKNQGAYFQITVPCQPPNQECSEAIK
ncbi:hypothetical protein CCZ01_01635 [Helicobacter monodelphidis]|uniref:sensor histidine kinase n=1 Tax=Helicobacter sp. 15-1451 TaxID=2004995 RepID=UPI000DCB6F8F|nr:PAS domain-containing sensor histidine kinase [Helicobacter sp. 15-1451]RAX58922.1 hypothetical protein CCZ01_01635 [Helicobacter sp. 15-1451]